MSVRVVLHLGCWQQFQCRRWSVRRCISISLLRLYTFFSRSQSVIIFSLKMRVSSKELFYTFKTQYCLLSAAKNKHANKAEKFTGDQQALTNGSKRKSNWCCVQGCASCACCSNSNFVWTIRKLSWKIDTWWCRVCRCSLPPRFSQSSPLHFKCLEVISLLFCKNWKVDFHCTCTQTCCGFFHNTATNPIGPHLWNRSIWKLKMD